MCLWGSIAGSAFEECDASAEDGDLFLLLFELTALFLYFLVGDALCVGLRGLVPDVMRDGRDAQSW